MEESLFQRAVRLLVLNRAPGWWNRQSRYRGGFYEQKRAMKDEDIRAHLLGRSWIACRVPEDGLMDRIVFDIDCKREEDLPSRDQRYRHLRELFGRERTPLVWGTPSGMGIRAAYRIAPTPVAELATSESVGILPAALRAAGLDPELGSMEFFPGPWRCDRQLFGHRMPLRDPETLEPVPAADLGDQFSEAKLRRAVELTESWHAQVDEGLVADLATLPGYEPPDDGATGGPEPEIDPNHGLLPPATTVRLIREGLDRPHSRYRNEFVVGRAMWLWPELFADLGLAAPPEREGVARCLAEWLAARTNGYSQEWRESLRRGPERAKQSWVDRYLRRNGRDGLAPVDRMRRAAAAAYPELWPTVHLTPTERKELLRVARRAKWSGKLRDGADLYRFEVWASACLRVAKKQIRRGGESGDRDQATAQIAAEWMEGWPWGKQYVRFRRILKEAGVIRVVKEHSWNPVEELPGRARTYQFSAPEWWRRNELPMDPEAVKERIAPLRAHDRDVSIDEAYHALHIADTGADPRRLYGRRTAERIERYLRALRPPSPLAGF